MTVDQFRGDRAEAWAELAELVQIPPRRRKARQVLRLSRLHREAVADLATARRRWPGEAVVGALEDLVALSHAALFAPSRGDPRHFLDWVRAGAWRAMAERAPWVSGAAMVLLLAALAGAAWVTSDPDAGGRLVTVSLRRDIAAGDWIVPVGVSAAVVGLALGAAGLIGAAVLLAWVGLEMGAALALAAEADGGQALASLAAAAPLVTAVLIATAAGARAGWSLVRGDRGRFRDDVAVGAQLLATLVPLLVVSSIVRDAAATAPEQCAAIGGVVALAWWAAVFRLGRAPSG